MTFKDYARFVESVWISDGRPLKEALAIMSLGLGGEAGEVQEHIKKLLRDDHIDKAALKKELGDVLYYWTKICTEMGFTPDEVMQANVDKLTDRLRRGVLRGNGDDR